MHPKSDTIEATKKLRMAANYKSSLIWMKVSLPKLYCLEQRQGHFHLHQAKKK
jgi:hypothetical protein